MNKKGFTLVELLGVLLVISLITILVLPNIINWLSNSSDKYLELNEELIIEGARIYVEDHPNIFVKNEESVRYITMQEMIDYGSLDEKNVKNIAKQSYENYRVKVVYNGAYFEYYLEK